MSGLLHVFLHELLSRCRGLQEEVAGMDTVPPEVKDYRDGVAHILERTEGRIQDLIQDPDVLNPALARNYAHDYKRLAETVRVLEWRSVLALVRYSERDRLATLLCQRIAQEIAYPHAPPTCVAMSASHYWTSVAHNLIGTPLAEPFHLLGLSDLYHEMGHILLFRNRQTFEAPFLERVDGHYDTETGRVTRAGRSPEYREALERHRMLWKRHWVLEFASDMIAAYLAGSAYGWSNVRLCADLSTDPYASDPEADSTHPADDARNTAICMMLEKIGSSETAAEVQALWDQYVGLTGQQKPREYELRYPSDLLIHLLDHTWQACQALGLIACGQATPDPEELHITTLLNEAWEQFRRDPGQFSRWETEQVKRVRNSFGL